MNKVQFSINKTNQIGYFSNSVTTRLGEYSIKLSHILNLFVPLVKDILVFSKIPPFPSMSAVFRGSIFHNSVHGSTALNLPLI